MAVGCSLVVAVFASALFAALEVLGELLAGAFYFLAEPASLEAAAAFAISHDIVLTNFSLCSYVMVKNIKQHAPGFSNPKKSPWIFLTFTLQLYI